MTRLISMCALLAIAASAHALDSCDVTGEQAALQAVAATMDTTCPCAAATTPSGFKRCVKGVVATAVGAAELSSGCGRYTLDVYLPSTCGYPSGSVACAPRGTSSTAGPRCRILRPDKVCRPPTNGVACASPFNCYNAKIDTYSYPGPPSGPCSAAP